MPGGSGDRAAGGAGARGHSRVGSPVVLPRARGPRRHATTARAPAGGGAQELHSRRDGRGAPASGELWPGQGGTEGLVGGSARVVRGRGAYGGCSAAPARGSERGARQSSSSGKSIRRSASGAELGATIDRCQMNTCGPEHHAVGEGRLGHGASLPARGRALGARVAARLGSGAPQPLGAQRPSKTANVQVLGRLRRCLASCREAVERGPVGYIESRRRPWPRRRMVKYGFVSVKSAGAVLRAPYWCR